MISRVSLPSTFTNFLLLILKIKLISSVEKQFPKRTVKIPGKLSNCNKMLMDVIVIPNLLLSTKRTTIFECISPKDFCD